MAAKLSYLFRSPTGFYEYRRKVPARLRFHFPRTATGRLMSEWKKALKTKDEVTAQKKWVSENERFIAALQVAELISNNTLRSPTEALAAGKAIATQHGVHPLQAPMLRASATPSEIQNFKREVSEWNEFLDHMHDQYIHDLDVAYRDRDGNENTPNELDPKYVALRIMKSQEHVILEPTWSDAIELYIKVNKAEKRREIVKEKRWERETRNLLNRFASANGGLDIKLSELERQSIRRWLNDTYTNVSTRNRYVNVFSAVINNWNKENKVSLYNPFAGLANKKLELETSVRRRSFKPEEWFQYLTHIENNNDIEFKLISLLMLYTGCRTNEAAGLQVRDMRTSDNLPHVVYRTNSIRRMDKDGLERTVPLLAPILDVYRTYKHQEAPESPLFPRYGHTRGFDNVSVKQRHIVNDVMGIKDPRVVPYSTRHTFIDRGIAAGVSTPEREFIVGHKSDGSSRIHARYGTMPPPEFMLENMIKILSTRTWGYYED